jgi:hypothetical protein
MLDVAAAPEARGEQFLLVGDAIAVRIGVLPHFVRVRLRRQYAACAEWQDEPWKYQLVDEYSMVLVHTVVIPVFVDGDAPHGRRQIETIERLIVAAQLQHEHASVAIERDLSRLLDFGIGQHRFKSISGRKPEALRLFVGRHWKHRRLRREVRVGIQRVVSGGRFHESAAAPLLASDG